MDNTPLIATESDVKDQNLLLRFLRRVGTRIGALNSRISNVEAAAKPPTFAAIRSALQAAGPAPLNVQSLPGILAQPQPAGAPRLLATPTGLVLQQLQDTQLVLIANGTNYDLYSVIGGNPTTLQQIVAGSTGGGGNFMTTTSSQAVSGTKTYSIIQTFNAGLNGTDNSSAAELGDATHRWIGNLSRVICGASTPTVSIPSGFGTGPSAAFLGANDLSGVVQITVGTAPGATGSVTVTYSTNNGSYGNPIPAPPIITPADGSTGTWDTGVTWKLTAATNTAFTVALKNGAVNLSSGARYNFAYHAFGLST